MYKMAFETQKLKTEVYDIIINIDMFEFEERKHVQKFITELYNQYKEVLEETLDYKKNDVVSTLISKYEIPTLSTFIGSLLRLYTKSNRLIDAFQDMEILNKLSKLISNPDFNI